MKYDKIKNEMAIEILVDLIFDTKEELENSENEELKEFVIKIEIIKDMLVNL